MLEGDANGGLRFGRQATLVGFSGENSVGRLDAVVPRLALNPLAAKCASLNRTGPKRIEAIGAGRR